MESFGNPFNAANADRHISLQWSNAGHANRHKKSTWNILAKFNCPDVSFTCEYMPCEQNATMVFVSGNQTVLKVSHLFAGCGKRRSPFYYFNGLKSCRQPFFFPNYILKTIIEYNKYMQMWISMIKFYLITVNTNH